MSNEVTLQEGHPVDENKRPLKVGGEATALEVAKSGKGVRVRGDLEVTGESRGLHFLPLTGGVMQGTTSDLDIEVVASIFTIDCSGQIFLEMGSGGVFKLINNIGVYAEFGGTSGANTTLKLYEEGGATEDDYLELKTATYGNSTITTVDAAGTAADLTFNIDGKVDINSSASDDIELDAGGDIILDANGGNITLLDGGSTYTPTATSDAVPLSYLPFVLYSQFQDDLGTSKHYIPLKGYFEQALVGQEPAGMIAPFNMKLNKIVLRSSEDISGGTWKIGMWAIDSGDAHGHHHTNGMNWISATGGVADTNAVFDFTGTVGLATSGSGGSNAVTAGQWIDFQISSDTDVTSSNAEFWITMFFIADLSSTI